METKICKDCGQELPTTNFYTSKLTKDGYNCYCKDCHKKRSNVAASEWIKRNPYENIIRNRWKSINQRTVNGKYITSPSAQKCPQLVSYRKKGIALDMTFDEFRLWMLANEILHNEIESSGDKSSIDRIDESLGYSIDNIQMISLHANICKRYGKDLEHHNEDKKAKTKIQNKKQYNRRKK